MRKFFPFFFLLLAIAFILPDSSQAAGRLNFMLTNVSGYDITEVKIAPTYYPEASSDNLLNTGLESNTRIYIGPNFYGDERFWNITLTWANGYTHTWTHNQLTRYNSYVIYANNYGLKMRQGFEYAFARYDGRNLRSYSGSRPNMEVAIGTPEKVNVAYNAPAARAPQAPAAQAPQAPAAQAPQVQANQQADSGQPVQVAENKRRTRDLVFDEEDDTSSAPKVEGSAAADVSGGESIAVKATVELTRDSKLSTVLPTADFKSGDRVRLLFSANRDGNVYWVAKGTSGTYQVLFPTEKAGMDNSVIKNKEYTVPVKGAWKFDNNKGTETIVCILSPNRVAELDQAVQTANAGKKDEASSLIAKVVSGHETKRTTRDLVFEEEDEADVNTKTQQSKGGEPFVAIYELNHQ